MVFRCDRKQRERIRTHSLQQPILPLSGLVVCYHRIIISSRINKSSGVNLRIRKLYSYSILRQANIVNTTNTIATTNIHCLWRLRLRSASVFSFAAFSSASLRLRSTSAELGITTVSSLLRLLINSATLWVRSWRPFIAIAIAEITGREICFSCNSATGSP